MEALRCRSTVRVVPGAVRQGEGSGGGGDPADRAVARVRRHHDPDGVQDRAALSREGCRERGGALPAGEATERRAGAKVLTREDTQAIVARRLPSSRPIALRSASAWPRNSERQPGAGATRYAEAVARGEPRGRAGSSGLCWTRTRGSCTRWRRGKCRHRRGPRWSRPAYSPEHRCGNPPTLSSVLSATASRHIGWQVRWQDCRVSPQRQRRETR